MGAFEEDGGSMKAAMAIVTAKDPALQSSTFAAIVGAIKALDGMPLEEYRSLADDELRAGVLVKLKRKVDAILSDHGISAEDVGGRP